MRFYSINRTSIAYLNCTSERISQLSCPLSIVACKENVLIGADSSSKCFIYVMLETDTNERLMNLLLCDFRTPETAINVVIGATYVFYI